MGCSPRDSKESDTAERLTPTYLLLYYTPSFRLECGANSPPTYLQIPGRLPSPPLPRAISKAQGRKVARALKAARPMFKSWLFHLLSR